MGQKGGVLGRVYYADASKVRDCTGAAVATFDVTGQGWIWTCAMSPRLQVNYAELAALFLAVNLAKDVDQPVLVTDSQFPVHSTAIWQKHLSGEALSEADEYRAEALKDNEAFQLFYRKLVAVNGRLVQMKRRTLPILKVVDNAARRATRNEDDTVRKSTVSIYDLLVVSQHTGWPHLHNKAKPKVIEKLRRRVASHRERNEINPVFKDGLTESERRALRKANRKALLQDWGGGGWALE